MNFTSTLISWYNKNKRELPWRNTKDPYYIWLSEIILQQTRVEQGLPYYLSFISNFPSIFNLAKAPADKVMKLWQGLGYYSRAINLHFTAKQIVEEYNGVFPSNFKDIKKLKGIGDYTASAIASFSFNLPYAVVDGNVIRVISRVYGIQSDVNTIETKSLIQKKASELLCKKNPGIFNQAIMEFGALQCKPQNPDCENCSLNKMCFAFKNNLVEQLPLNNAKIKTKERYFNYLVINSLIKKNEFIYIRKRKMNDIWKNLYDFPCIEYLTKPKKEEIINTKEWKSIFLNKKHSIISTSKIYKHILSHQILYVQFYEVNLSHPFSKIPSDWKLIAKKDLKKYGVPRIIEKYFQ
ncbi:MAG TPA: A/G-specific adenine glycosylase [Bacteroidales bacterium]|nr:A/G-specific adenine glycosylase [Bacteroidales bacterium]